MSLYVPLEVGLMKSIDGDENHVGDRIAGRPGLMGLGLGGYRGDGIPIAAAPIADAASSAGLMRPRMKRLLVQGCGGRDGYMVGVRAACCRLVTGSVLEWLPWLR